MQRERSRLVGARAAVVGIVVIVALVSLIVAGLEHLLAATQREPALEAPADRLSSPFDLDEAGTCPEDTPSADPAPVTADVLIECPRLLHGRRVVYRGEAVRAVLERGGYAWLHVNDDDYALDRGPLSQHRTAVGGNAGVPVRIPRQAAEQIDTVGDARHHGTIIEATGTWLVDGAGDGGAPGIRADDIEVLQPGRGVADPISPLRVAVASVLALLAALTAALSWWQRQRDQLP